ncbi:hypothetical protein HPB49_023851 [Dermacentor silvarum]|uniref:Uncharacterized protein n=1 Tax=Dermacentor silvarum TaxID=543639 RepID=A0ACB8CBZ6_DERSI|nr:hypothetical protein HPB49_023851 [Dermacentor silvarum]
MKEKSRHAVVKNFKEISFEPKKQKKVALKLLKDMHLNSLRQLVNTADAEFLEVFFTRKTHKPDHPLRVIVSEKASWQCHLGKFLQTHLKKLPLKDPFLTNAAGHSSGAAAQGPAALGSASASSTGSRSPVSSDALVHARLRDALHLATDVSPGRSSRLVRPRNSELLSAWLEHCELAPRAAVLVDPFASSSRSLGGRSELLAAPRGTYI